MVCSHCKVEKEENIIHWSGNIIDDTPQYLPDGISLVKQYDLIAGPLKVECKARERKFVVWDYESIVDFFHKVKDL